MMIDNNRKIEKYMKAFMTLPISQDRLNAIADYLSGNTGVETLDQYPEIDMKKTDCQLFQKMLEHEYTKNDWTEASKLFQVYFSLGRSNAFRWFPRYANDSVLENEANDKEKLSVVYAGGVAKEQFLFSRYRFLERIEKLAEKNPEILKNALRYLKEENLHERLILSSVYLLFKYGDQHTVYQYKEEKRGILSRAAKIFERKQEIKPEIAMENADIDMLFTIEKSLIHTLEKVIGSKDPSFSFQELKKELWNEELSDLIVSQLQKGYYFNEEQARNMILLAYLNYPLSRILRNIVRVFSMIDAQLVLKTMHLGTKSLKVGKLNVPEYLSGYDQLFYMEPGELLKWASSNPQEECRKVLSDQLTRHPDIYVEVLGKADVGNRKNLVNVLKAENPDLWDIAQQKYREKEKTELLQKIIKLFPVPVQVRVTSYLNGEIPVSELYEELNQDEAEIWWYAVRDEADRYLKLYEEEELRRKIHTLQALVCPRSCGNTLRVENVYDEQAIKVFWSDMRKEELEWRYLIDFAVEASELIYMPQYKEKWDRETNGQISALYLADRERLWKESRSCSPKGKAMMVYFYWSIRDDCKKEILSFVPDTSKLVRNEVLFAVSAHPEWEADVLPFLNSKKSAEREFVVKTLLSWANGKDTYHDIFSAAMAKEKNSKMLELFSNALNMEGQKTDIGRVKTITDLIAEVCKSSKKKQLSWIYEKGVFAPVHKKDGSEASKDHLQAICLYYASMNKCGVNQVAKTLSEELNEAELSVYANTVFDIWMADGAQTRYKWVLYYASIHGGDVIVEKLKHNISEWPQHSRGAIAAEAVRALVLNPTPQALLLVDGISRKFKFRQVKDAAGKALEFAAAELGLTREELEDRIVPDLGFDKNMEKRFDYGERIFTVTITPALEVEVRDDSGRKLKTMPSPGKKDDEAKAAAAYAEFKQLKKQMKATVTSQKMRLEHALSSMRFWNVESWNKLFVENPIMHQFAIGLIWGIYEENNLVQTFRYMEDGSFNTEEEEEFDLPEQGKIGLVHPLELTQESIAAWKEQLSDYEIQQPFEQLERPVFLITEEEKTSKALERFGGVMLNDLSLAGKLLGMNWYRGSIQDGGMFMDYYKEDTSLGLGVDLDFSGSYAGGTESEMVTVYEVRFYKIGTIRRGSYVYEEIDDKNAIALGDVPNRYFSEIVMQLTNAMASSKERDENWRVRS